MKLHDPSLALSTRHLAMPVGSPGRRHVVILMGLYNGAPWLSEQLESLAAQTHRDWSLIIGDDGSEDESLDIIHDFAKHHPAHAIRVVPGPRKGFQANFLNLLGKVPQHAAFVAFSDQDDVWLPEKLETALVNLETTREGRPALYCGRTIITDNDLQEIGRSPLFKRRPRFENALVQSIAGGNTMVMNRPAGDILRDVASRVTSIISHDWWSYQVISGAGGRVIYDPEPQVLYRQHEKNLVGSNAGLGAKLSRLMRLIHGELRRFNEVNIAALDRAETQLTARAKTTLDAFAKGRRGSVLDRILMISRSRAHRQTRSGTIALFAAALFRQV